MALLEKAGGRNVFFAEAPGPFRRRLFRTTGFFIELLETDLPSQLAQHGYHFCDRDRPKGGLPIAPLNRNQQAVIGTATLRAKERTRSANSCYTVAPRSTTRPMLA
jgi:hypothetical protein